MLRALYLILFLVAGSRQFSIKEFKVPQSARLDEQPELLCLHGIEEGETGIFVKWFWRPLENTEEKFQLYQMMLGHEGQSTQKKNISIMQNSIILLNLSPSDSGIYECNVSNMTDEVEQAQKLVVYSYGTLELNATSAEDGPDEDVEEDVNIECQANDVAPLPDITLIVNGELVNTSEVLSVSDTDGLYDVQANVTLSKSLVENVEIECILSFPRENDTIPSYSSKLTYSTGAPESSTTESMDLTTVQEAEADSLQNPGDGTSRLACSWILLIALTFHGAMFCARN